MIANQSARFQILPQFNDEAIYDKVTGLIWMRFPRANQTGNGKQTIAIRSCLNAEIGGQRGWRVPTAEEVGTLISFDEATEFWVFPSVFEPTTIPPGGVGTIASAWTSTRLESSYFPGDPPPPVSAAQFDRDATFGFSYYNQIPDQNNFPNMLLCVRGGSN